jgi:MFS family permease
VLGRFVLMMNEARVDNRRASWISLWALLAAALALWLAGLAPELIFLSALCQGAGIGMLSILRPILTVDYLGRAGFGAVSGAIAVAPILATAAAPSVGALLLTHGGPAMIYAACVATVVAAIAVWAAIARQGTDPGLVE